MHDYFSPGRTAQIQHNHEVFVSRSNTVDSASEVPEQMTSIGPTGTEKTGILQLPGMYILASSLGIQNHLQLPAHLTKTQVPLTNIIAPRRTHS